MNRIQRATGAVVGSAVGDALGAPYEFGPTGVFSQRFPASAGGGVMRAGGGRVLRLPELLGLAERLAA